jgi:hypothetical protein
MKCVIIIVLVIILFVLLSSNYQNTENFMCNSCDHLSKDECLQCSNCGYYKTAYGEEKCANGTRTLPYFKNSVIQWEHKDANKTGVFQDIMGIKFNIYNDEFQFPYGQRVSLHKQNMALGPVDRLYREQKKTRENDDEKMN